MSTDGTGTVDVGELIDARMLEIEKEKEKLRLRQQAADIMGKELEALQQKIQLESKSLDQLRQIIQTKISQGELELGQESELKKELEQRIKNMKKFGQISSSAFKKMNKLLQNNQVSLTEIDDEMQKIKGSLSDVQDFTRDVERGFSDAANKAGFMFDVSNTAIGRMSSGVANLFNNMDVLGSKMKSIGSGFLQLTNPTTVMANVFQMMIGIFQDVEKGAIAITRAIGGQKDEAMKAIIDMESRYAKFGVSMEAIGKNFEKATFAVSGFRSMNRQSGLEIAAQIGMLEKFGASADTQLKMINKLTKITGKNIKQANDQVRTLVMAAREMGIDGSMALTDFDNALSKMSSTGAAATREFMHLAHQAKATGTSVQELLGIAVKFDTFKDAANFVAMLNGTLGTNLSSIEIMQMDMGQRVEAIREGILATVGSFDDLDRGTKLMIANQIAGGDITKAKMMLKMATAEETAEHERAKEALENQQRAIEQLVETGPQLLTFMDELRATVKDALGGSDGLKESLKMMVTVMAGLTSGVKFLMDNLKLLTGVYIAFRAAVILSNIHTALATQATFMKTYATVPAILAEQGVTLAEYQKQMAMKMGIPTTMLASKAMLGFGTALRFAGGPLLMIITLLLTYYGTMLMTSSPALYLIAGVMALGVIALGTAMYFAGPAIIPVVLALALLMGALALVFHALPLIIEAMGDFMSRFEDPTKVSVMASALTALGGAFLFLGASALVATIGIAAGAIALVALRASMFLSGTSFDDMQKTGESIFKVGTGIERFSKGLSSMAATAAKISESLGDTTLVATVSADKTSLVAGKDALFASLFGGNTNITVDVNMPEQEQQMINVKVFLDGEVIDQRIYDNMNRAQ